MLLFHSLFSMLSSTLLALSLFYAAPPECSGGTAWVDSVSDPPAMLQQAKCDGCKAVCDKVGTKSEGWYSSCDGSLIEWTMCGTREPVACTMDAKLCPDGVTYVGRDGSNNCEWQKCPGEGVPDTQCAPYVCADGTTVDRCTPEGTVINYFAEPCLTHGGEEGAPFKDVTSDHVNADAIFYVKQQGIVQGYEDGTYKPESTINRAEFVKILMGAFPGDDRMCKIAAFADVDQSAWYASFAHAARCRGVVSGYDDGTFRPGNSINFVEAAKIIVKAFGLEATSTLPACEGECPWYRDYVLMLEMRGAIPMSVTSFDQSITRGEMAEMIWRLSTGNNDKPSNTYEELASPKAATYRNDAEQLSFEYPASYGVVTDRKFNKEIPEWYRIELSDAGHPQEPHLTVEVDPAGYGPIFADVLHTAEEQKDGSVRIVKTETFDDEYTRDGYRVIVVGGFQASNGKIYYLRFTYREGGENLDDVLESVVASLRIVQSASMTDATCSDTYASTGVCPAATCIMDCADRDNPPKEGLGCPPGCFAKPR